MCQWIIKILSSSCCWEGYKEENVCMEQMNKTPFHVLVIWCLPPAGNQDVLLTGRKPLECVISMTSLILCQLTACLLHSHTPVAAQWQWKLNMHSSQHASFWEHGSSEMGDTQTDTHRWVCVCVSQINSKIFSHFCVNPWVTVLYKQVHSAKFLSNGWYSDFQGKLMSNVCWGASWTCLSEDIQWPQCDLTNTGTVFQQISTFCTALVMITLVFDSFTLQQITETLLLHDNTFTRWSVEHAVVADFALCNL